MDLYAFKIYMLDVGLLLAMTDLDASVIVDGNRIFTEFKGALTEQYVLQQLKAEEDIGIYYYTNERGGCEIDFLVDDGQRAIPIEVKAEINLKAKSLKTYREKYSPEKAVRISMADYKESEGLIDIPLYTL